MSESRATTAAPGPRADGAQDSPPLLEVRGLTKTFGSGRRRLTALDGVDIHIGRGQTLGLVGESGCGKSTLARVLLGLERPDAGTVRFDGTDPFALRGKELLAWRRRVQMVFQDPFASLNARMSAADLIGEPWRTHKDVVPGAKAREKRIRELLDLVGLRESDAHRYPNEFSGGQRQRIGIARALALDPDLIVLRRTRLRPRPVGAGAGPERTLRPAHTPRCHLSPFDIPSGCRFRTRCRRAEDRCATQAPPVVVRERADGAQPHTALCHFPLEAETAGA
ncbi:hypothetical protein SALBM311S_09953 [Streptomyces alboniger]